MGTKQTCMQDKQREMKVNIIDTRTQRHTHTSSSRGPLFQLIQSLLFPLGGESGKHGGGKYGRNRRLKSTCFLLFQVSKASVYLCVYCRTIHAAETKTCRGLLKSQTFSLSSNKYSIRKGSTAFCTSNLFKHWLIPNIPITMSGFICHSQCEQLHFLVLFLKYRRSFLILILNMNTFHFNYNYEK